MKNERRMKGTIFSFFADPQERDILDDDNKKGIAEIIHAGKTAIQTSFSGNVNFLKEELAENCFLTKQNSLDNHPINMAIAEDIGYEARGRSTNNNELVVIGKELAKFISPINETENQNNPSKNETSKYNKDIRRQKSKNPLGC